MKCSNENCQEIINPMVAVSRCYECDLLGRVVGSTEVDVEFMNKFYRIINVLEDAGEMPNTDVARKVWFKVSQFRRKLIMEKNTK